MVAQNLKTACTKITDNVNLVPTKLKEGDLVLIKDHTAKAFQPRYVGNYRIVSFKGNQVEVCKIEGGNTTWVHLTERCTVSKKNTQREDLEISWPVTKTWSFSGPPICSKSKYT